MADKVNWIPNLRVDIVDLEHGTHGYAGELVSEQNTLLIKDYFPRVIEGFRVEITDAANRQITVYGGCAIDQSGRVVTNEESLTTARSITLGGDATYYIEIEYVENFASTDARAFWDPSFDNGLDDSGDVLPDGREISQNVSTRKAQDWEIVNPPSTSGYDYLSDPASNRIPLATITVSGGAITAPLGVGPARTCFTYSSGAGATAIRGLNTRLFPDSFDVRLGEGTPNQEDGVVVSNDRESGILTLSAPTVEDHDVGERITNIDGDATDFIDEFVLSDEEDSGPISASSTAGDRRPRLYQGDSEIGYALSQDTNNSEGTADFQIRSLKNYVDFLASQIKELKFGGGTDRLVGNNPPPDNWSDSTPNYYESAGSVLGARTNTVSVGNGASNWGDFNIDQSGSALTAIQSAIAALPTEGGIVYLKAGDYEIVNTGIICDKPVIFLGDGAGATRLLNTGSATTLTFTSAAGSITIKNIEFSVDGGSADYCVDFEGASSVTMENCTAYGVTSSDAGVLNSVFTNCMFDAAAAGISVHGDFSNTTFSQCVFANAVAAVPSRSLSLTASIDLAFRDCQFTGNATMESLVSLDAGARRVIFDGCRFVQETGVVTACDLAPGGSFIKFANCRFNMTGGVGTFDDVNLLGFIGCNVDVPQDDSALILEGGCGGVTISDCNFDQATTSSITTGVAIDIAEANQVSISGCRLVDCDYGIYMDAPMDVSITACKIIGITSDRCRGGIVQGTNGTPGSANWASVSIIGCLIQSMQDDTANNFGIYCGLTDVDPITDISVSDCIISTIGNAGFTTTLAGGIVFELTSGSAFVNSRLVITNNTIDNIEADTTVYGIRAHGCSSARIANNAVNNSCQATTGTTTARGIALNNARRSTITGNTVSSWGHSGQTLNFRGISVDSDTTVQGGDITITGNTVQNVGAGAGSVLTALRVEDGVRNASISSNTVTLGTNSATTAYGILVISTTDDNFTASVSIVGNVIIDDITRAIRVVMDDPDALTYNEGRVSISSNTISGYTERGIDLVGAGVSVTVGLTISGNTLTVVNDENSLVGIMVEGWFQPVITGNSVFMGLGTGDDRYCVHLDTCNSSVISGNSCTNYSTGDDTNVIRLTDCNGNMTTGNYLLGDHSGAGGFVLFATGGARQYADGNYLFSIAGLTSYEQGWASAPYDPSPIFANFEDT